MRILVTGVSGYVGAALVPRLRARRPRRARLRPRASAWPRQASSSRPRARRRDQRRRARRGARRHRRRLLPDPLDGARGGRTSPTLERASAETSSRPRAPPACGGSSTSAGWCPHDNAPSRHLELRLAVEEALLDAAPEAVALRASIVIGARSRSFRFLVRLVERMPVIALPAWRVQPHPADRRARRARVAAPPPRRRRRATPAASLDIGGPGRRDLRGDDRAHPRALLVGRPALRAAASALTPVARSWRPRSPARTRAHRAADGVAGERPAAARRRRRRLFGVRLHGFDAAVERALRDMGASRMPAMS